MSIDISAATFPLVHAVRVLGGTAAARMWCAFAAVFLVSPVMAASTGASHPLAISEKSFHCITELTHVRHFYVDNLAGDLKGTVRAANSTTGASYPVGSVLQLVPTEVMVKREKATHDWEFFELNVSPDGSKIRTRGVVEVNNRFGGNCFGCHVKARPEWDQVCDNSHGCDPTASTIEGI